MSELLFSIEEASSILDKELKPNVISVGIDGAMKHTGICVLKTTDKNLYLEDFYGIDMKGISKNNTHSKLLEYYHEFKLIRDDLCNYPAKYKREVIIEDCWFGQNVTTLKVLAKYSVVAFFVMRKWAKDIKEPVLPTSARKSVGFKKNKEIKRNIKLQIQDWVEDNFFLEIDDDNLSDAFILALYGLIEGI